MALPKDVKTANVYLGVGGFRYTCRDSEGKIVHDSPRAFKSRLKAKAEILSYWPEARVSMEVM